MMGEFWIVRVTSQLYDPLIINLRIDYCDERSDYKEGDISGPKGTIVINDISIESPDVSLVYEII